MSWRKTSWQWQLVLIMMLVSGIALLSFISVSWQIVRITTYKKVDAELVAFSLRQGWSFMMALTRVGEQDPRMRLGQSDDAPRVNSLAFCNLETGFYEPGLGWPEEIDVIQIGNSIPALYQKEGKPLVRSRFLELQRITPEERRELMENRNVRPPRQHMPGMGRSVFKSVEREGQKWRIMAFSDGTAVFLAAHNMSQLREDMHTLGNAILIAFPVAISIIGLIAWYLAGKAIDPVKRLTSSASEITAEALGKRLQESHEPPEFENLIKGYNQMLDRLEKSFLQASRFSADAAHELNTPLMILRGHLDLLLQSAAENSDTQKQLAMVLEEVRGLQEVIRKLLLLSQADSGRLAIDEVDFDFSMLVNEIVEDAEIMAPEIELRCDIPDGIPVKGDRDLLRQCVFNLITNAIKYNREDGHIILTMEKSRYAVQLDIRNTGQAIPEDKAEKVFDRFYRVDPSRDAKVKGRGLGLSLAHEFAKAHHGSLELVANEDDNIVFRLTLPA